MKSAVDIRSFIRLAGYYRRFVKDFSKIAAPMIKLTRKGEKFVWTEEYAVAFEEQADHGTNLEDTHMIGRYSDL